MNLLPCPFCGLPAQHIPNSTWYLEFCGCQVCQIHFIGSDCVERWNTRAVQVEITNDHDNGVGL